MKDGRFEAVLPYWPSCLKVGVAVKSCTVIEDHIERSSVDSDADCTEIVICSRLFESIYKSLSLSFLEDGNVE